MIKLVQDMFNIRDISHFKTADMALTLLTSYNDFNKFQTLFTNITKLADKKTKKQQLLHEVLKRRKHIYYIRQ